MFEYKVKYAVDTPYGALYQHYTATYKRYAKFEEVAETIAKMNKAKGNHIACVCISYTAKNGKEYYKYIDVEYVYQNN